MITIEKYCIAHKVEWDHFIRSSKNGVFLFERNYMDYHKDRFLDHSLIAFRKGKIVALLPANENRKEVITHGGLSFGGLIMHFDLKAIEVLDIFQKLLEYYSSNNFNSIIYKALPSIFHKYPSQEDLYALYSNNAVLFRRDISSIIDLSNPIRFSETKRQSVTKCQKNNVVVIESNDFSSYWDLLTNVLKKFNTKPVHDLEEIHYLKNLFPQNIKLYEARINELLLAGILIYEYEHVVHTQYMANSDQGRTIGALDYINHKLISEVYKDRKFYSFGISTESGGQILNNGLIQQKETMGGRGITYDFYKIDLQ
jgi:hypothetical protein